MTDISTSSAIDTVATPLKERVRRILDGLKNGIYEKDEAIGLGLLAAVAGESIFLLGPPGVAKSLIARRLKYAFSDGKSFEYLMNKFSTPDELFGPVSIKKLKDEDKYERLTDRYMPGANVVFLDEIWKAGPSIQNALLTIVNEKIYRNGEEDVKVDIHLIISASNELPPRNEGLEALWDRFLIRYTVQEISNKGNFLSMITQTDDVYKDHVTANDKIDVATLQAWTKAINEIELPKEVLNTIQIIKHKLEEHDRRADAPFNIYDRRWKKMVNLLRTSALLNGRKEVDLMDCFLLSHCLWSSTIHQETLREIIAETIRNHGYSVAMNLTSLKKEVNEFEKEVQKETKIPIVNTVEEPYLIERKYYELPTISNVMDGQYIKAAEFERLGLEEETTISLYDKEFKLTYKIRTQKSKQENEVIVIHNSQAVTFPLRTEKKEIKQYIHKQPHPIVLKYWNEQHEHLVKYIEDLQNKASNDRPAAMEHLYDNLFVDKSLAAIVEANMNDGAHALRTLSLQLEKVRHYYQETLG